MGSLIGDKIEMRNDIEELTYEVVTIQNKFVRAFQETIADFSTRFPGNTNLSRIVADEGDFTNCFRPRNDEPSSSNRSKRDISRGISVCHVLFPHWPFPG